MAKNIEIFSVPFTFAEITLGGLPQQRHGTKKW
jgi:hypothetical protein